MHGAETIAFGSRHGGSAVASSGEFGGLCDAGILAEYGVEGACAYLAAHLAESADYLAFSIGG